MGIITLKLPPGMFRNGTPYMAKGRYVDGNLVRWHDGSLRPIGGWRLIPTGVATLKDIVPDPAVETVRDARQWRDNVGNTIQLAMTNLAAYYIDENGGVTDVTPAGFVGGSNQPSQVTGYGTGTFGLLEYGTARPPGNAAITPVYRWSHSLYGEDLFACPATPTTGGLLYQFDSSTPGQMTVVAGAPTDINGVLVTDERIVMAVGGATTPRLVRWSSRENPNDWVPTIGNEAGDFTLQGNGRLYPPVSVLNQILILSESDAHVARYVGAPFIYGFDRVGSGCGPLNGASVVTTERFAMWPSERSFFLFDGTVRKVPCDVMDFAQADFNDDMLSKMFGINIPEFSEIWWFYQSEGSTEDVDSYIAYDYDEGHWQTGKLQRTIAYGGEGSQPLLMIDNLSELYHHEIESVNVEGAWGATGPLDLKQGEQNIAVKQIFPDTQNAGDVTFTLYTRDMPTAPEYTHGPYPFNNPTPVRAMGRQVRIRYDGVGSFEVGDGMRLDVAEQGTGRR